MNNLAEPTQAALIEGITDTFGEQVGRHEPHDPFPGDAQGEIITVPTPAASHKWIALGVGDILAPQVMAYVIGACRRMEADLLLLAVDGSRVRQLLAEYLPDLQGIECRIEELSNRSAAAAVQALDRQHGVLFAVSGSEDDPLHPLLRARRGLRSPVPVVLVTPKPPDDLPGQAKDARS